MFCHQTGGPITGGHYISGRACNRDFMVFVPIKTTFSISC